jgi:hypothetical protein
MARTSELIEQVARLLNDAEPGFQMIRWTRADLLDYFNDAQRQVYAYRPELFTQVEAFTLRPGTLQGPLPAGCQLQRVVGSDGDTRARKVDDGLLQAFAGFGCKPACACDGPYRVSGFSFNPEDAFHFFVDPPVPVAGGPYTVKLMCQQLPQDVLLDDLDAARDEIVTPGKLHNALIEFMCYRAYSVDMESGQSNAKAMQHLSTFNTMLGIAERKAKQVAQSQSGNAPEGARP